MLLTLFIIIIIIIKFRFQIVSCFWVLKFFINKCRQQLFKEKEQWIQMVYYIKTKFIFFVSYRNVLISYRGRRRPNFLTDANQGSTVHYRYYFRRRRPCHFIKHGINVKVNNWYSNQGSTVHYRQH